MLDMRKNPNSIVKTFVFCMASLIFANCGNKSIPPQEISASSVLPRTANYSYEPVLASDGKPGTTWAEGSTGDGIGDSLTYRFGEPANIASLEIINGFPELHAQLGDLYFLNNRVKTAVIEFEDGTEEISLKDNFKGKQLIKFSRPHTSKTAKLIIKSVYPGTKWRDTCIAELSYQVTGRTSEPTAEKGKHWVIEESVCGLHCAEPTVLPGKYTEQECKQRVSDIYKSDANKESMRRMACEKEHGKDACEPGPEGGIKRECVERP